jgi:hypothetical protein
MNLPSAGEISEQREPDDNAMTAMSTDAGVTRHVHVHAVTSEAPAAADAPRPAAPASSG